MDGLRAVDTGAPDLESFRRHHEIYVDALRTAGVDVTVLQPLEAFPDSVFIEDAALCLPEVAIPLRPGTPSRLGEAEAIAGPLADFYGDVVPLAGPGFIDGGDILTTEREILVGQSARTDATGIAALREIVDRWNYSVRELATPPGVLHFKSDCALLDAETILSTARLAVSGCFADYKVIVVPENEEPAANCVRVNDLLIVPAGFKRTVDVLDKAGYELREVPNSEAAKLDGGMSCLSLRFTPVAVAFA